MSGPSDKARFYLEQTAADLNELVRKQIFTKEEVGSIARQRSSFEHVVNARGAHASDFLRYIDFEKHVNALRQKRVRRLGAKHKSSGQRTVYALYGRATRKFAGDLSLWMQYIDFARRDRADKRLSDILTAVVRLHSTKPELWIYAARYFLDVQADITDARSYMQRGLRFCKRSQELWLEYARLETTYCGKVAGRRQLLGLDGTQSASQADTESEDTILLPTVTAGEVALNTTGSYDEELKLQHVANAPAFTGAISLAIFDAAMEEFDNSSGLAERFFSIFAEFDQVSFIPSVLDHVVSHLERHDAVSVGAALCRLRRRLYGVGPWSSSFPPLLAEVFDGFASTIQAFPGSQAYISQVAIRQILTFLPAEEVENLDPAVRRVLRSKLRYYCSLLNAGGSGDGESIGRLEESLRAEGKGAKADLLVRLYSRRSRSSD